MAPSRNRVLLIPACIRIASGIVFASSFIFLYLHTINIPRPQQIKTNNTITTTTPGCIPSDTSAIAFRAIKGADVGSLTASPSPNVGDTVGVFPAMIVGSVGLTVGDWVGLIGEVVGDGLGDAVGALVEGDIEGRLEGKFEGEDEGNDEGNDVESVIGAAVGYGDVHTPVEMSLVIVCTLELHCILALLNVLNVAESETSIYKS